MILHRPITFTPYYKHVIWGGTKINDYKGVSSDHSDIGETWEISVVPGHDTIVEHGEYQGQTLAELVDRFGEELLGDGVIRRNGKTFPMLVKFIDAKDSLSVQVHPDNEIARKRHNSMGKAEMWYIISTSPGAKMCVGLKEILTPDEFFSKVADNTIADMLVELPTSKGDIFYVPAGCVHAIGAGNLLVEIQQSSDITYRLYDYNRHDLQGNLRELHKDLAYDAIDYKGSVSAHKSRIVDGLKEQELVKCEPFEIRYYEIEGNLELDYDQDSFTVVICVEGEVNVICRDGSETIRQGHTLLIPAAVEKIEIEGHGTILTARS